MRRSFTLLGLVAAIAFLAAIGWLVASVGACAPRSPPLLSNFAAPARRPECTAALVASLDRELRERWRLDEPLRVRCVPGRFPEPGFYIEGTAELSGFRGAGILAASGNAELVAFDRESLRLGEQVRELLATDLDGDGADEIVESWRKNAHGSDSWVIVRRRDGARLDRIEGPHLSVSHPSLGACAASTELTRSAIVVSVSTVQGIPPSNCLAAGRHTFRLHKNALVGIRAP